jgi:GTP pyrophosphokinase
MLKGSKIIDLAYQISPDIGNTLVGAYVNGEYAPVDYTLQNKDRIKIITDELSYGPREDWLDIAKTSYAKKKIREFNGK